MSKQGSLLWPSFLLLALALIAATWMVGDMTSSAPMATKSLAARLLDKDAITVTDSSLADANSLLRFNSLVPDAWLDRTPLPTRTSREGVAPYGQSLYVIGGQGHDGANYVQLATLQRYDVTTNSYTALAPMPHTFANVDACAMNGKVYVPGGYDGIGPPYNNDFLIYDIASNTWSLGPAVPGFARLWYAAVCDAANSKLYVIAGFDGTGSGLGTVENRIFNATTNSWSLGAPLPGPRYGSQGGLINGNIYITGGLINGATTTNVQKYNIATNTWSQVAPMNVDGAFAATGVDAANGTMYVAGGGFSSQGQFLSRTERYNASANTWTVIEPLLLPLRYLNGGFIQSGSTGLMHAIGGNNQIGTDPRCPGFGAAGVCDYTQQLPVTAPPTSMPVPSTGTPGATVLATFTHTYTPVSTTTGTPTPTPSYTSTSTNTPTSFPTDTPTDTPTLALTPTDTPAPSGIISGHVTWQSISQPSSRNVQTATLALCVSGSPASYDVTTDASGFFTVTTGLSDGAYNWRFKANKWLASAGNLTISGGVANPELGAQRGGDANDSNNVNSTDFTILKSTFGKSEGQPGYDARADFDNNHAVNSSDFNVLKGNFGQAGALANCP